MEFVHSTDATLCPAPPSHMLLQNYNASIAASVAAFPSVSCVSLAVSQSTELTYNISDCASSLRRNPAHPCGAIAPSRLPLLDAPRTARIADPQLVANRMQRVGRTLWHDGAPMLIRAICYSPAPVGHDPGYGEPWGDYFTTQYEGIFTRDIDLFVRMGANTIRLYTFKTSTRHGLFLDAADAANLTVLGAFEIGTAEHTPLGTLAQRSAVRTKLRRQIRASKHPALTLWFVGNEINGAWQGFICDDAYAELHLSFTDTCQFKDDAFALMAVMDDLCEVVHEEGMLCSTPLAGVAMPGRYLCYPDVYPGCAPFSPLGWVQKMDGFMRHLDVWAFNLYPGRDFVEFNFSQLEAMTNRPFFVSEYGIDAYNIDGPKCDVAAPGQTCNSFSDPRNIGVEDPAAQAEWVQSLIEGIEQNAVTCVEGCESRTVAGGSIMAWVD